MITIYKYQLKMGATALEMPLGAKFLTASIQNDEAFLWAEVNTENDIEIRCIKIFGTGFEIPQQMGIDYKYIATIYPSPFVFHVYEVIA